MLCYAVLNYTMLCYAVLHCDLLCYTMLHCAMLCYSTLCCATLYYAALYYTILCYSMQGVVLELSYLVKSHKPNGHNNQMDIVDLPEGYELDTFTTHKHL